MSSKHNHNPNHLSTTKEHCKDSACSCEHIHSHSGSCSAEHNRHHGESCHCEHEHHHGEGCHCGHDHHHDENDIKVGIIRIIVGTLFLIGAILTDDKFFNGYLSIVFFITAYIVFGYDVVINAFKSIIKGRALDEHFLMAFATICAFVLGKLVEAVAVMLFYQVGEFLQETIVNRSKKSIRSLMEIQPESASVLVGDTVVEKKPEDIKLGDIIVVKAGEKVAVDGEIVKGSTSLDTSALTGESIPVVKNTGDSVLSGSINNSAVIYVRAEKLYQDSTVSRIMDMVENASAKKAKTENFVTRFAKIYTPVVVALAVVLAIVPTFFGVDLNECIYRALIFLVASCPCALVLSIPLTFFAGIGTMSRNGVLVKGGNYIELLSNADAVVLDKTGTITKGSFEVTEVSGDDALKYAASLECFSTHPMAIAVTKFYKDELIPMENVENIAGFGLKGKSEFGEVMVGSERLMTDNGISVDEGRNIYVALNNEYVGYINVEDTIKEDSQMAIAELKSCGIGNVTMLTGDRKSIAEKVGKAVGVDNVYAELLPQNKVEKIDELYSNGVKTVIAVGDGINDAPILAGADVGVAMGGIGSDAAIEAADVVIMQDSLSKLPIAINVASKTMAICRQNVVIVIALKILVLAISAVGYGNMWLAVFADVGVALIAVLNSIRITKISK